MGSFFFAVGILVFVMGIAVTFFGIKKAVDGVSWGLPAGGVGTIMAIVGGLMSWYYLALAFLLIMMMYCMLLFKQKQQGWGRFAAGGLGVIAVLLACSNMLYVTFECADNPVTDKWRDISEKVQEARFRVMGEYIAEHYPGHTITIITEPPVEGVQNEKAKKRQQKKVDMFKQGLAGKVTIGSIVPAREPIKVDGDTPLVMFGSGLTAKRLDELVTNNSASKMFVIFSQFPFDYQNLNCWRPPEELENGWLPEHDDERLKFVIFGAGNPDEMGRYIAGRYINVVLLNKPGFRYDPETYELPDGGYKAVFDERFVIASDKNLKEFIEKYPDVFKMPEAKKE